MTMFTATSRQRSRRLLPAIEPWKKDHDYVVIPRSDYTDVENPIEFSFNDTVAANLGTPIGFVLDVQANDTAAQDAAKVSTEASSVAVWVIATNEELQIARHSHLLVGGGR